MHPVSENLVDDVLARLHQRRRGESFRSLDNSTSDLKNRMTDALAASASGVFEMMCGWQLTAMAVDAAGSQLPAHDLSGIISISGSVRATIIVSSTKELAFAAAEQMLGSRPDSVTNDVVDLVGELTNMIAGNAKERVAIEGLILGLPTVAAGSSLKVAFESGWALSHLAFQSDFGPVVIQLGIAI